MDLVEGARRLVQQQDQGVSSAVYDRLRALNAAWSRDRDCTARLAPEVGRSEMLLVVDAAGEPPLLEQGIRSDSPRETGQTPGLGDWIRLTDRGEVLVARWLCHLLGLRHRAVQLFLDHPVYPDYTLVQIRSLTKPAYPGCVDIPAAGHVVGTQAPGGALLAELAQELGLNASHLSAIEPIGSYASLDPSPDNAMVDAEYRLVYAARLSERGMLAVHFADGEVAALAVCDMEELQALMRMFPDRVASGLRDSWPYYLQYRQQTAN